MEDQAFSPCCMIWLLPHLPPPSSWDTCWRKRGEGGWERSQTIRQRESLIISKSFNTLWFYVSQLLLARKHCEISPDMCTLRSGFHKWSSLTWSYSDSPGAVAWAGVGAGEGAGAGAWGEVEHSSGRTPEGMEEEQELLDSLHGVISC